MKIAIIGLGYVGLPLSLQFASSGVNVLGLDVDESKIEALLAGKSYIKHIEGETIAQYVQAGQLSASNDFSRIREVDAAIICVPTPLNKYREPDLSYVLDTAKAIAPFLGEHVEEGERRTEVGSLRSEDGEEGENAKRLTSNAQLLKGEEGSRRSEVGGRRTESGEGGRKSEVGGAVVAEPEIRNPQSEIQNSPSRPKLIVLESTTYPGTKEEDLLRVLEAESGLKAGVDFHLAFSPEREDPGRKDHSVKTIPKVMGGLTPACLERCVELYSQALDKIHPVSSCRIAEATKLTENIFRSVNIALVNELKMVFQKMDIDVWEVIDAAATKPFGFMPFYPGPGLGGHCIPIDPFYLTWKAREFDMHTRFIELAGEVNTAMPNYVISRISEALNAEKKSINGSKILIVGLAYKPDVDDDRESPSYVLLDQLKNRGADVAYFDPHVPVIRPTREHGHWAGTKSVSWDKETISSFDCVVISTAHGLIDFSELGEWASNIVDTRNAMAKVGITGKQVLKA